MTLSTAFREALAAGRPAVIVTVERAEGSTPREAGAAMLVTPAGTSGTIGGGALEMEAILEARRMIAAGAAVSHLDIPLGPAIGQCCGGRVALHLAKAEPADVSRLEAQDAQHHASAPRILVFGAGHTGQALARALLPLPFRTSVIDTRPNRLAELEPEIDRLFTVMPETVIDAAEPGAAFVIMTHDHALDFLLAARALERGDAAYVGMIGSATKLEKFRRHLGESGSRARAEALVLPIGGQAVRDKRPAVIAALTASELLQRFSALENVCTGFAQGQSRCNKVLSDDAGRPVREAERHAATS